MSNIGWRWLHLSFALKSGYIAMFCVVLLILMWCGRYQLQWQQHQQREEQITKQYHTIKARQRILIQHPSMIQLQTQRREILSLLDKHPRNRSLAQLIAAQGNAVHEWQPAARPEKIVLNLSWPQFQRWFIGLAKLDQFSQPVRFRLESQDATLRMQIWLEYNDVA